MHYDQFVRVGPVIFGGIQGIISFLQEKGFLSQQKTCHCCLVPMNIARRASLTEMVLLSGAHSATHAQA